MDHSSNVEMAVELHPESSSRGKRPVRKKNLSSTRSKERRCGGTSESNARAKKKSRAFRSSAQMGRLFLRERSEAGLKDLDDAR